MTREQACARRAHLESAKEAAYSAYHDATVGRQQAEVERATATRAVAATRTQRATGGASDKAVEQAHKRITKAETDYADQLDRANAALDAVKAIEQQLDQLYSEAFTELVEEAEDVTQAAHAAVLALEAPYEHAREAWDAAVRAWAPLARAARIDGVGDFPMEPWPELVRAGDFAARPPGVEVLPPA